MNENDYYNIFVYKLCEFSFVVLFSFCEMSIVKLAIECRIKIDKYIIYLPSVLLLN